MADGEVVQLDGAYIDVAAGVYGEWGLTDTWTAVVTSTPLGFATVTDSTVYSGTTLLGVRRALSTGDLKLAVEARAGGAPPIGDEWVGSGTLNVFSPLTTPVRWFWQPVVPTFQAEGELQLGRGFSWGWVSAAAGGRWTSSSELPESILGLLAAGGSYKRLGLSLSLSTVQPLTPITDDERIPVNVSGAGATRYIGFEPGLSVRLTERLSLTTSIGGAMMAQSNAATPAFNLGIEHR